MMNLLNFDTAPLVGESFQKLLENDDMTIELIISSDQPEPRVYDQDHDEIVLLIKGSATILINKKEIKMKEGDFMHIKAHTVHQVLKVKSGTRWFCIHAKNPLC